MVSFNTMMQKHSVFEIADLCVNSVQSFYDLSQLQKVVTAARIARCRQRFAVPVILFEGKVIILSRCL